MATEITSKPQCVRGRSTVAADKAKGQKKIEIEQNPSQYTCDIIVIPQV